jgi:ribonuclease R
MSEKIESTIVISAVRKMGFIPNPDEGEDIHIPEKYLNHALYGDTVLVELTGEKIDGAPEGKVTKIVNRAQLRYVGTVQKRNNTCFVIADSKRMHVDIYIDDKQSEKLETDDKVYVEIIDWKNDKPTPAGKIIEILGKKGEHEVEMRAIILEKGIEADFPKEVDKEAEAWLKKWPALVDDELPKRKDYRDVTTFTIDPASAKDFDDALSVKKLDNGNFEIGIHIADVSYFVRPETELDKEGAERAFSVYLVDRTIPMLPEVLSNDLCSLNPNEPRLAFSAIFEITPDAKVVNEWFGRTVIKSDRRFSYEEAQENLDKQSGEYLNELNILNDISLILTKEKLANGAIKFEKEEFEFELDANKVPIRIYKKEPLRTHKLIEEFMLLANKHVAKFIHDTCKKGSGSVCQLMYRTHNSPDRDKLNELSVFLKALGYNLHLSEEGDVSAKDLNALLAQVSGKAEESLVTTAAIRTMTKALYTVENSGHFGLAFEYYTHFTSPIRRYPDLVVHRILQSLLDNGKLSEEESRSFAKVAEHSTNQEINAQEAERNSIKYKQVEFMKNHVGEEFTGIISGVAQFGIFVVIDETGAEGLVHISKLGDEYFEFDEKNYRIVAKSGSKKYTLGDKIKIKIEGANLDERKLDMSVVQ